jgi:hypothetical protein
MTGGSEPLSSRNKHVRHVADSRNRKGRNDGNERGDGNPICGVARSTSRTARSAEGDCSTDEAWSSGLRGTEALLASLERRKLIEGNGEGAQRCYWRTAPLPLPASEPREAEGSDDDAGQ